MNVSIDAKELKKLERAKLKLEALEAGGVDNWTFYGESLTEYNETIQLEEDVESFVEDIIDEISSEIHEPSERGGGYGITEEGQERMKEMVFEFLKEQQNK